jgi:MFS family permease
VTAGERQAFEARCAGHMAGDAPGLTREGFRGVFADLFREASTVEWLFDLMDADGNGFVTVDEALAVVTQGLRGTPERRLEFYFRLYDRDADGALTVAELHTMLVEALKGRHVRIEHPDFDKVRALGRASAAADHGLDTDSGGPGGFPGLDDSDCSSQQQQLQLGNSNSSNINSNVGSGSGGSGLSLGDVEISASRLLTIAIDHDHSGRVSRAEWIAGASGFLRAASKLAPMIAPLRTTATKRSAATATATATATAAITRTTSAREASRGASAFASDIFDTRQGSAEEMLNPLVRARGKYIVWLVSLGYMVFSYSLAFVWPQDHALVLSKEVGWGPSRIGLLMIAYQVGSLPSSWFSGALINKFGLIGLSRMVALLLVVSSGVCGLAILIESFPLAMVGRVLQGFCECIFTIQSMSVIRHAVPSQYELGATSLVLIRMCGYIFGRLAIGPLPVKLGAVMVMTHGFGMAIFAVVVSALDEPIRRDCGRVGRDGKGSGEQTIASMLSSLLQVTEASVASISALPAVFWNHTVVASMQMSVIFTFGSIGAYMLRDLELSRGATPSETSIAFWMSLQTIFAMILSIPSGMTVSRFGRRGQYVMLFGAVMGVAHLLPTLAITVPAIVVALIHGFGGGAVHPVIQTITSTYMRNSPDLVGTAIGVLFATESVFVALFTFLVSQLVENPGSLAPSRAAFMVTFALSALSCLASVAFVISGNRAPGALLGKPTVKRTHKRRRYLISGVFPGAVIAVDEDIADEDEGGRGGKA